jgi:hypothetical protein
MTRRTTAAWSGVVRGGAVLAGAAVLSLFATPVGAVGGAKASGNACRPLTVQKAAVHAAAAKRETTLVRLASSLQARKDPGSMNAGQISALQSASAGIAGLDAQIQSACYATVADFRSDATKLFTNYRVYWLRVPQTRGIEAADWLADARTRLGTVATKLASHVGTNTHAKADLAAMNQALAAADAKLGIPPKPAAGIAQLPTLAPAADMTADVAAMEAARRDLKATRAQLAEARADGLKVLADLGA